MLTISLTRPLRELSRVAQAITAGDLAIRKRRVNAGNRRLFEMKRRLRRRGRCQAKHRTDRRYGVGGATASTRSLQHSCVGGTAVIIGRR